VDTDTYSARISSPGHVSGSHNNKRIREAGEGDASSEEGILPPPGLAGPRVGITRTTDVSVVSQAT